MKERNRAVHSACLFCPLCSSLALSSRPLLHESLLERAQGFSACPSTPNEWQNSLHVPKRHNRRVVASAGRVGCAAAPASARQGGQAGQARRGHHRLPIGQDRLKRGQRGYDAGKRVKGRKRHTQTPHSRSPELLVQHAAAPRIAARINLPLWHTAGTLLYAGQWLCATVVLWRLARR